MWMHLHEEPVYDEETMTYLIVGFESCPTTGKMHYQCYVVWKKSHSLLQMREIFGGHGHYEVARGSAKQNFDYCSKEHFKESGTLPTQGKRMELQEMQDDIKDGMSKGELYEKYPQAIRYTRGVDEWFKLYSPPWKPKKVQKDIRIWWGATGAGKSHKARELFPDAYVKRPNSGQYFMNYTTETCIVVEEFKSATHHNIGIDEWNDYLNEWEGTLRIIHGDTRCYATTWIILSNDNPEEWWPHESSEIRKAFFRRIKHIVHYPHAYVKQEEGQEDSDVIVID